MGNMSYCRFQNTTHDLQDCMDELIDKECLTEKNDYDELLSRDEFDAAIELIEMARHLAEQFEGVHLWELQDTYKAKKREENL